MQQWIQSKDCIISRSRNVAISLVCMEGVEWIASGISLVNYMFHNLHCEIRIRKAL